MRIWQSQHVFDHSWDMITQAQWQKYPNPNNSNVLGMDVIDRQIASDGSLTTHRLLTTKFIFPRLVMSVIGCNEHCYASEKSVVNPRTKSMVLETRNLTLGRFINVDERMEYTPHPTDSTKTLLKQEAIITINGLPSRLEDSVVKMMVTNASKGRQAIDWVVDKISREAADLKCSIEGFAAPATF